MTARKYWSHRYKPFYTLDWVDCPVCAARHSSSETVEHLACHATFEIIKGYCVFSSLSAGGPISCTICGELSLPDLTGTANDVILNHMIVKHAGKVANCVTARYGLGCLPFTPSDSVPDKEQPLTEVEALDKIEKACEGCTGDDACCAIAGLKLAGWTVEKSPAINADGRKGFVLTALEPLTKDNQNVSEPRSEPDRK